MNSASRLSSRIDEDCISRLSVEAPAQNQVTMKNSQSALNVWLRFCDRFKIAESSVPLFAVTDGVATTKQIGRENTRRVLSRSEAMEAMLRSEASKAIADFQENRSSIDGLIYMMLRIENGEVIPLYIGKAGTVGKTPGQLSANMSNIERDKSKFCRWGDNYAYHVGDLSAIVLAHPEKRHTIKYRRWAEALFTNYPTEAPVLKGDIRFWCIAWSNKKIGIWEDFGPVGLKFLEYLLIGVAGALFPQHLLNTEGN